MLGTLVLTQPAAPSFCAKHQGGPWTRKKNDVRTSGENQTGASTTPPPHAAPAHAFPAMQVRFSSCVARAPIGLPSHHCRLPLSPQRPARPAPRARPYCLPGIPGPAWPGPRPASPYRPPPSPDPRPPSSPPRPPAPWGLGGERVAGPGALGGAAPVGCVSASLWQRRRHAEPSAEAGRRAPRAGAIDGSAGRGRGRGAGSPAGGGAAAGAM